MIRKTCRNSYKMDIFLFDSSVEILPHSALIFRFQMRNTWHDVDAVSLLYILCATNLNRFFITMN